MSRKSFLKLVRDGVLPIPAPVAPVFLRRSADASVTAASLAGRRAVAVHAQGELRFVLTEHDAFRLINEIADLLERP